MDLAITLYHTGLYQNDVRNIYPNFLDVIIFMTAQKGIHRTDDFVSSPDNGIIFSPEDRLLTDIDLLTLESLTCQAFPDYIDLTSHDNHLHYNDFCAHPFLSTHFTVLTQANYVIKIDEIINDLDSRNGYLIHTCRLQNLQPVTECWEPIQYRFDISLTFKDQSTREISKIFTLFHIPVHDG